MVRVRHPSSETSAYTYTPHYSTRSHGRARVRVRIRARVGVRA